MKVTWLGQAGLLFETNDTIIMVDPYLSDSVEKIQPNNKRRVKVDKNCFNIKPNIIVLTHNHLDHTDPETLQHFITSSSSLLVLASFNAWQTVRSNFDSVNNNFVMFNNGTTWTEGEVSFKAVKAEHSDDAAIGFILNAEGKNYYITGDTLYNEHIFSDLPNNIDYVFLPVNGMGNNMNMADAKRFCEKLNAVAIPLHCGLFDDIDMSKFEYKNKVVPKFFEQIEL